jgi:hypothetical protein
MGIANILICGKIRDAAVFSKELETYFEWQSAGLVDRIGFSGWASDLEPHVDLIAALRRSGISVVMSPEPQLKLAGHIFHQMKALNFGLSLFNPDAIVLKTRTDRADMAFDLKFALERFLSAPRPAAGSPFEDRVLVQYASPFQPYFFGDQVFMGRRRDLERLVTFDMWFEAQHAFMNPEQIMHTAPHLRRRPFIKHFLRANPGLQYNDPARAGAVYQLMLGNPLYLNAIHAAMHDLMDHYIFGFKPDEYGRSVGSWPVELTLHDLVTQEGASNRDLIYYHPLAATISTQSTAVIRHILEMPISPDEPRSLNAALVNQSWIQLAQDEHSSVFGEMADRLARDLWANFNGLPLARPRLATENMRVYYAGKALVEGTVTPPTALKALG